jgi:hypothetical protein
VNESDVRAALRDFVVTAGRDADVRGLTDATPLFGSRYLTSVELPELLLLIEHLRGEEVDVVRLEPGDLADVDTILAVFFGAGHWQ